MNSLVDAVKATGTLGVVGVFVPQDPGAEDAREGRPDCLRLRQILV
jgi:glutathione-independent formaldehyde dehydrogenase